jgi:hypothetical protein
MWQKIFIALVTAAAVSLVAGGAGAQSQGRYPWQSAVDVPKYDPNAEINQKLQTLGLQPNKSLGTGSTGPTASPATAVGTQLLRKLDTDHDGGVSQDEYLATRGRTGAGKASATRQAVNRSRLQSRFRSADVDGNGILSQHELNGIRDPRF